MVSVKNETALQKDISGFPVPLAWLVLLHPNSLPFLIFFCPSLLSTVIIAQRLVWALHPLFVMSWNPYTGKQMSPFALRLQKFTFPLIPMKYTPAHPHSFFKFVSWIFQYFCLSDFTMRFSWVPNKISSPPSGHSYFSFDPALISHLCEHKRQWKEVHLPRPTAETHRYCCQWRLSPETTELEMRTGATEKKQQTCLSTI